MRMALAPMDGITDCAYRLICKHIFTAHKHPDDELMLWTEFMSADGYCHNPPGVIRHLLKTEKEPELIAQIFGGDGETLLACARDIEKKYSFAGIELNMGCPSPKIMRCAAGSGMLKDKQNTLGILAEMSQDLSLPLSLKTRVGLTEDDVDEQFDFLIEASKYVRMIAVHGRTYKQGHSGEVDREFIYRLKEKLPDHVIIGNGGLRSYEDAVKLQGPLDGMMTAQSAIGNPRVLTPHEPTVEERYQTIVDHLDLAVAADIYFTQAVDEMDNILDMPTYAQLLEIVDQLQNKPEIADNSRIPVEFRKYLFAYVTGLPNNKDLKKSIARTREYAGLVSLLEQYFSELQKNTPLNE